MSSLTRREKHRQYSQNYRARKAAENAEAITKMQTEIRELQEQLRVANAERDSWKSSAIYYHDLYQHAH